MTALTDGEVARVLARNRAGLTVAQGDGAALAQAVVSLAADPARCREFGVNARDAFDRQFDMRLAVGRWRDVIRQLAPRG